ncbi:MAG: TolC family outer membrane protein [Rickettsiales bacterium]
MKNTVHPLNTKIIAAILSISLITGCDYLPESLNTSNSEKIDSKQNDNAASIGPKKESVKSEEHSKDETSKNANPKSYDKKTSKPDSNYLNIEKTAIAGKDKNDYSIIDDVSLRKTLEYVYDNHPQIKAKREELKAIDENVAQAISGFRPDVTANLSKGRERIKSTTPDWNYGDSKSKNIVVNQPIFKGGRTLADLKTSKERVKAARAELLSTEQELLFNAVVSYTDVVEKYYVLKLNQKNVDVLKRQLEATKSRFKVGDLTLTDVSQSEARLARAVADERQALGDLEVVKATFNRIIGYEANKDMKMPPVPSEIPTSLAKAQEIASSNNPILIAARHLEKSADSDVYSKASSLLPDVSLQGVASRSDSANNFSSFDSDSIKLNVTIPIYRSGAEWSRLRQARNLAQQAKFNTIDTNKSIIENVTIAWEAYNTSKEIIKSNQAAVEAAKVALNGVRKENEYGVRTILDVLDAEQEAFFAEVSLIKAIRNEKIQAYRLLATIGKLTNEGLKIKTTTESPKKHYDSIKYQLIGL